MVPPSLKRIMTSMHHIERPVAFHISHVSVMWCSVQWACQSSTHVLANMLWHVPVVHCMHPMSSLWCILKQKGRAGEEGKWPTSHHPALWPASKKRPLARLVSHSVEHNFIAMLLSCILPMNANDSSQCQHHPGSCTSQQPCLLLGI